MFGKTGINSTITNFREFRLNEEMAKYKVSRIACGDYHTLALTDDGVVFSWGGTLGEKTGHKSNRIIRMERLTKFIITDIACGDFHSLALTK